MTIYILVFNCDSGQVSDEYVTKVEDIEQLAIDHYWGILTKPEPGRLKVTVDMVLNTVTVVDMSIKQYIEYDILEFEKKS